jgi:3-deoxy-D-manno-octulosonic acid kinase
MVMSLRICSAWTPGRFDAELASAGYEILSQGPDRIMIRREWRSWLVPDLLSDFRNARAESRRVVGHGRVPHFSYLPEGASSRVVVRLVARGGVLGRILGGLHGDAERPLTEVRAAIRARSAGVASPEVLATHSRRVAPFVWRHRVVTSEIAGGQNLLSVAPSLFPPARRSLIQRVAEQVRRLHEAGVYPADLTVGNIVLAGEAAHVVDLDKAFLLPRRTPEADARSLARLHRSAEKHLRILSRADRLRFLRHYLGGSWCLRDLAARVSTGLWRHRVWWAIVRLLQS